MKKEKYFLKYNNLFWNFILFLISFSIIYILSFSRNPHPDEAVSIFCSLYYFLDCILWEIHFPTYYFFIYPIVLIFGKIEILRIFSSIFVAFAILIGIKTIEKVKNLKLVEKIIIVVLLSLIPSIYSAALIRPYNIMLFFSSLSLYYFIVSIGKKIINIESLYKSFIFDNISAMFFPFSIFLLISKNLYIISLRELKLRKIIRVNYINLIFFFILLFFHFFLSKSRVINDEDIIKWYENFKDYYFNTFLINFPIELYKDFSVLKLAKNLTSSPISRILIILIQILFLYPFTYLLFSKDRKKKKLTFFYFLLLFITFTSNFFISLLTSKYIITSRQFVHLSFSIIILLIVFLKERFYFIFLIPIFYIFSTLFILKCNFIYNCTFGLHFILYEKIPPNHTVIIYPYWESINFWYFEKFVSRKNLTLIDTIEEKWYEKNISHIIFRVRKTDSKPYENPYDYRIFNNIENFIKIFISSNESLERYCKTRIERIEIFHNRAIICK